MSYIKKSTTFKFTTKHLCMTVNTCGRCVAFRNSFKKGVEEHAEGAPLLSKCFPLLCFSFLLLDASGGNQHMDSFLVKFSCLPAHRDSVLVHVEGKEQFCGVTSLLPLFWGSWGSKSGLWAWRASSFITERAFSPLSHEDVVLIDMYRKCQLPTGKLLEKF